MRRHHRHIGRVAIVTKFMPKVLDPVTTASVRGFDDNELQAAITWASGTEAAESANA